MFLYSNYIFDRFENLYNNINTNNFLVQIISNKEEKEYTNKYVCKVIHIDKKNKYKNTKLFLYTDKDLVYEYGDILYIQGEFNYAEEARNYKGFNYRRNLWQDKIYGILNSTNIVKISHINNLESVLNKIKIKLEKNIDECIKLEDYREFLKGILLGDKSNLSNDVKKNFRDASLSHLLAISGMHIGYIVIILKYLLNFINNKRLKNIINIIILILFIILIGKTPSSIRAIIMFSMTIISEFFYRKSNSIINLITSLIILLIINPLYIENLGVWLSFGGTFAILIIYSKFKLQKSNKIINFIYQNFLISFSVQIIIFPIIIYNFNTISITFFISNILISFFIGPIIFIGLLIIFIGKFFFIGNFLIIIENFLLYIIFNSTNFISNLKLSKIYARTPLYFNIILYYIILFFLLYKKDFIQYLKFFIIVIILVNLIISLFEISTNQFTIYFIDVGQGDCTLIKTKSNKTILVDGGEGNSGKYDEGEYTVLPYLFDRRITKLDYIMVSHFDSDHVRSDLFI